MVAMDLQRTYSLLLLPLLVLPGLLVQPSKDHSSRYNKFLWQHVDTSVTGGNDSYCNKMMRQREMTRPCKQVNTFIHNNIKSICSICNNPNIKCKNNQTNCHEDASRVTVCTLMETSKPGDCKYNATTSNSSIVIACEGTPKLPVHFDR